MKAVVSGLFAVCLALSACARASDARLDDFSLTLEWDTGALPPPYHYSYIITIGPGQIGHFSFQPGYAPEASDKFWKTDFNLESKSLDTLYQSLVEKGALNSNWETGQPLMGGNGTSLVLTAGGQDYRVPSVSILAPADREKAEAIIEVIRAIVPKAIWDEMSERQAKFEAGFED